jgi:hypothetical protein
VTSMVYSMSISHSNFLARLSSRGGFEQCNAILYTYLHSTYHRAQTEDTNT